MGHGRGRKAKQVIEEEVESSGEEVEVEEEPKRKQSRNRNCWKTLTAKPSVIDNPPEPQKYNLTPAQKKLPKRDQKRLAATNSFVFNRTSAHNAYFRSNTAS